MKTMDDTVRAHHFDARLSGTVCGYLLFDPDIKSILWSDLAIEQNELDEILSLSKHINGCGQTDYRLTEQGIDVLLGATDSLKNLLKEQLSVIVKPPRKRAGKQTQDYIANSGISPMQKHDAHTLRLFDSIIEVLESTAIKEPNGDEERYVDYFIEFATKNRLAVRELLNGLLTGEIKPNENITHCFNNVGAVKEFCDETDKKDYVASVLTVQNNNVFMTDAFEKRHNSVLPFILTLLDFYYLNEKKYRALMFSAMGR